MNFIIVGWASVTKFRQALANSVEIGFVEVRSRKALAGVETNFVWRRREIGVRDKLHHVSCEDSKDVLCGSNIDPFVIVLELPSGRVFPVLVTLISIGWTDE